MRIEWTPGNRSHHTRPHLGIIQHTGTAARAERRVRGHMNAAGLAIRHQGVLRQVRVQLDLVDGRADAAVGQQRVQVGLGKVTHTNRTHMARIDQRLSRAVSLAPPQCTDCRVATHLHGPPRVQDRYIAAHDHARAAVWLGTKRQRPVHQVQVQIGNAEVLPCHTHTHTERARERDRERDADADAKNG
jgi:hypothetical protein